MRRRNRESGTRNRESGTREGGGAGASAPAIARREVLATVAGAAAVAPFVTLEPFSPLADPAAGKFLTASEFALLDELTELIIPADDHSLGARAAKVAAYIDARLAEAFEEATRTRWRAGLEAVNTVSQETVGRPFMKAAPAERLAVLERMTQHEEKPERPEARFFNELKAWTVRVYYTSEIGLRQEMEYKGNTLLQEFAGVDVSKR